MASGLACPVSNMVRTSGSRLWISISNSSPFMPGMKGDEFLFWVAEEFPASNKILLTGHMSVDTVKLLEKDQDNEISCIYKPWDESKLLDLIKGAA